MSAQLRASVVIPAYQAAGTIDAAVRSALQSDDVEVIVCDDGSTDATAAAAEAVSDPRVTVLRLAHGGQSRARNAGIERARAAIVVVCDADDRLAEGAIARMLDAFEDGVGVVAGRVEVVGEDSPRWWPPEKIQGDLGVDDFLRANWIGGCTAAIRTDLARELGGFDPELKHTMDYNLWIRAAARSKVRMLPEVVGFVTRGRASFSSDRVGALEDRLIMLRRLVPDVASAEDIKSALVRTASDLAGAARSPIDRFRWRRRARAWSKA